MTNTYIEKLDSSNPPNTIAIFTLSNNTSFEPDYSSPVTPMPLPQNNDTQNILIKVEGNSSMITQRWVMKQYTSSVPSGVGSYTGFVAIAASDISAKPSTAFDQVIFLKNFILPVLITDSYRITVADSVTIGGTMVNGVFVPAVSTVNGVKVLNAVNFTTNQASNSKWFYQEYGTITGLKPIMSGDSPLSFGALITFQVGNVVSAYNMNVPSAPQNVTVTPQAAGSGSIVITWSDPTDVSGGIKNFFVYRRTWNDSQTNVSGALTSGTHSYTNNGLVQGNTYYYTVVATNSKGLGISSVEVYAVAP